MATKKEDRRRHISFKNNERDEKLMKYCDKKAETLGLSTYIKLLIEKDMKEKEEL